MLLFLPSGFLHGPLAYPDAFGGNPRPLVTYTSVIESTLLLPSLARGETYGFILPLALVAIQAVDITLSGQSHAYLVLSCSTQLPTSYLYSMAQCCLSCSFLRKTHSGFRTSFLFSNCPHHQINLWITLHFLRVLLILVYNFVSWVKL